MYYVVCLEFLEVFYGQVINIEVVWIIQGILELEGMKGL